MRDLLTSPRKQTLGALREEWHHIDRLISDLTPGQLFAPTPCPEWDVRGQIAHIIAAEYALADKFGRPGEVPDAELHASVTAFMNDVRIEAPRALVQRYREITAERLAYLTGLSAAE